MVTSVNPSALVGQGAALQASAARMQGTIAAATAALTDPSPAGADEVSAMAASAFAAHGATSAEVAGLSQTEQMRSAAKLISDAAAFTVADVANAAPITAAGAE